MQSAQAMATDKVAAVSQGIREVSISSAPPAAATPPADQSGGGDDGEEDIDEDDPLWKVSCLIMWWA